MDLIKFEHFEVKEELIGDVCTVNGTVIKQEPSDNTYENISENEASKFIKFEITVVKEEFLENKSSVDNERTVVNQEPLNTDEVFSEDDALESKKKDSNDASSAKKKHNNTCQMCSRDYATRKLLLSHICGSNKYFCRTCGKILSSVNLLKSHTLKVHRSYIDRRCCNICSKRFTSQASLDRHLREHHRKSKHEPMFVCDICETSFTFKCNLIRHIQRHANAEKTFRCGICHKAFFTDYRLTDHMLVHTGGREISCAICDKKFARRRTLAEHVKQHANKTPFKCDLCNKGFLTKWNLKIHTQKVHGVMIVCGVCKKDFAFESDLEKHRVKCTK